MKTIKEYAEEHGKTVQAVYKQLKAPQHHEELSGHVFKKNRNGKRVTMLDETAEKVLNAASISDKVIVQNTQNNDRIEKLEQENKILLSKLIEVQDLLIAEKNKVLELQTSKNELIEYKAKFSIIEQEKNELIQQNKKQQEQITELNRKKWWNFFLKKPNK